MKLKSLLTTLIVFLFFAGAQAQTADEIIEKYFKAIGGKDKLKAAKTMSATTKLSMQGIELPMVIYTKYPNKMKSVANFQGAEIIVAFDGKDAWSINPMMGLKEPQLLPVEQAKSMSKETESEFIDYKSKGHALTYVGTEVIDGVKCFKLEIVKNKNNDKEDITETYFFDAENYVPILTRTLIQGQEISTYMSDYQEVSGLMIPFLTETKVQGQTQQKITFEKITINEPIDDGIFAFPKK